VSVTTSRARRREAAQECDPSGALDAAPPWAADAAEEAVPALLRRVFGETAHAGDYVPREATQRAAARLEGALMRGRGPGAVLTGPPGLGKTLLLRVLEARMRAPDEPGSGPRGSWPAGDRACDGAGMPRESAAVSSVSTFHLPVHLPVGELCTWAVALTGERPPADGIGRLRALAARARARGAAVVLLIDDANSMPLETARAMSGLVAQCDGALRLALAAPDDARTSRVVAALGLDLVEHRLDEPMSEEETHRHVSEKLRRADAPPALWRRLDADRIRGLHALSGGNPRRLHLLAGEVLRGEPGRRVLARLEPEWSGLIAD